MAHQDTRPMITLAELRKAFVYAKKQQDFEGVAIGALDKADDIAELARQSIPWLHQRLTLLHAQNRKSEAEDLHYLLTQLEKIE